MLLYRIDRRSVPKHQQLGRYYQELKVTSNCNSDSVDATDDDSLFSGNSDSVDATDDDSLFSGNPDSVDATDDDSLFSGSSDSVDATDDKQPLQ